MKTYEKEITETDEKAFSLFKSLESLFEAAKKKGWYSITEQDGAALRSILSEGHTLAKQIDKGDRQEKKIFSLSSLLSDIEKFKVEPFQLDTFQALNAPTVNAVRRGLFTIGAESNTGKTSLLTHLAIDILQNNPDTAFLFYSLDDSGLMSGKRILSQLEKKDLFYVDRITVQESNKEILNRIFIKDSFSIDSIDSDIEQTGHAPRNVIIGLDYLQIVQLSGDGMKRELYNDMVKLIKDKQKELDCLFVLLSQLNRTGSGGSGGTFTYRETSEIENQSDLCINIVPRYTGKGKNKKADLTDTARFLKVIKNKLGSKGQVYETAIRKGDFIFDAPACTNDFTPQTGGAFDDAESSTTPNEIRMPRPGQRGK